MDKKYLVDKMHIAPFKGKPATSLAHILKKKSLPVHSPYITNTRKSIIDAYIAYSPELNETLVVFGFPDDMVRQMRTGNILINLREIFQTAQDVADLYHRTNRRKLSSRHRIRVSHS